MNIATIKKFKKEFDTFLEDGSVYAHFKNGGHRNVCTLEDFGTHLDYCYIDDEYVEFRKALAEGKTLQVLLRRIVPNEYEWVDLESDMLFTVGTYKYRIKPEEPKFKVGDWVRFNTISEENYTFRIKEIKGKYLYDDKCDGYLDNCCEFWVPQVDEYVWIKNQLWKYKGFQKTHYGEGHCFSTKDDELIRDELNCRPFIGELPDYLKDNK